MLLHAELKIYGPVRDLEDIEWRVVERISHAREAQKAVRGERGWVGSRDRTTSVWTRTSGSPHYRRRFTGAIVTDSAFATNS